MFKELCVAASAFLVMGTAEAARTVQYTADFSTGQMQPAAENHDGLYVRTLPNSQSGSEYLSSGSGGFGPTSSSDTKVVASESIGGETVRARAGSYFARSALHYSKNYIGLNNGTADKPRSELGVINSAHRFGYDVEAFLGFSIYVPMNFEHETGILGRAGANQLLSVKEPTAASRGFFVLEQYVPSGSTKARWYFRYSVNSKSTLQDGGTIESFDLGPVENDKGKWTDFVVRFRENPFSVDTNPATAGIAGAMNQLYRGNKGIMQVWKAEGPVDANGDRSMVLKVSKVGVPVGLVPHSTEERAISFRVYKYGWKENPTTVKGPVWFGFDEIRFGIASDGTGYSDVSPAGLQQSTDLVPKPPSGVIVQ
jgi:hypothetical protein